MLFFDHSKVFIRNIIYKINDAIYKTMEDGRSMSVFSLYGQISHCGMANFTVFIAQNLFTYETIIYSKASFYAIIVSWKNIA